MHHHGSSRASGQRRPRLLRASVTEPSLFTSSIVNHGSLDMSLPTSRSTTAAAADDCTSSSGTASYHRRATDLLHHVAYLSSCATSPVSSFAGTSSPFFERMVPRPRRASQGSSAGGPGCSPSTSLSSSSSPPSSSSSPASAAAMNGHGHGHDHGAGSRTTNATAGACPRRGNDELFGSSPASTHTSGSLDDLHAHHLCSAKYFSFPSFDTWDPDCQDKEDDVDD